MDLQTKLAQLLGEQYGATELSLRSITPYASADRAIERVDLADGRQWVLRAFQGDTEALAAELRGQAAVLALLERRGFPAPRVVRTQAGDVVAHYASWAALVLAWVEGIPASFAPDALARLGECAAALHTLALPDDTTENGMALPDCRLHPPATLPPLASSSHLPAAVRAVYDTWVAALQRVVAAAPRLPSALLHGDCWPGNAVIGGDGALTLVDWDGAGRGPAVMDLGYLLLTCHLGQADPFALRPDAAAIAAVARYDLARRGVLEGALLARAEHWESDPMIRKLLAREAIVGEVATQARAIFGQ